jgi:hypothetical protein
MVTTPKPKPDHELVNELALAKAEADEATERYKILCFEVKQHIQAKPGRVVIFGDTHEAVIEEYWGKEGRYDQTRLVQFRERADQHTAELLYGDAWIPEATKIIAGHWDIPQLKALAKRHGDLGEVEAAKLQPSYRVKLVSRTSDSRKLTA